MNMTLRGGSCLGKNFGTPFRLFYPFQNFLVALTMAASASLCDCWDFNSSGNPLHAAMNNATSCDTVCVEYGTYNTSLWINKGILTSRSRNCNATGDYASAIGNNYVNISDFTVENATSNLGWAVGNENNSQKGITLNTKCSYNKLESEQQQLPRQHGQHLSTQRVHIGAHPSPKPPLSSSTY